MAHTVNIKKEDEHYVTLEFIKGTKQGYDLMYNTFYIHLYYFAVSIIKDHDDAKDIVLAALEACFAKHSMFTKFYSINGYLFITVKNKCLKYLDYHKRFKTDSSIYEYAVPTEERIDAQIVRSEFLMSIYTAVETLPARMQQIFKMFYIEEKTVAEIAKALRTNPACVSTAKNKIIHQLRNNLNITPKHKRK